MLQVLVAIMTFVLPRGDAEALQRTAPEPITLDVAVDNVVAAHIASARFGVDADLLLSIAAHESHYVETAVGPEHDGLVSCGSMTPMPVRACVKQSVAEGYLVGAAHVREWIDAMHGNIRLALIGYAGGYRLLDACSRGPVVIRPHVDACLTPAVFEWRAKWIKRERARSRELQARS